MQKFTVYVIKFLEKLDFEEKKSPHTLVAYSHDILTAFAEILPPEVAGPKINGSEAYGFTDPASEKPNAVSGEDLTSFVTKYLRTLSGLETSTRARKVAALKKFFGFLKHEGFIQEMPSILVAPKTAQKIPHFISVDEALAVLATFNKNPQESKDQRRELLFLLLYGAGLRVSEACQLRWDSVNLSRRELKILGKGQKTRLISFPTLLQVALARRRETQGSIYIWGDTPLNTRTAYNYIQLCGKKAGLSKPIHPHALRHSFATHLLSDGADLRIIQELLGHSSLRATEKYTHVSMDQLSRTMETFHPLGKKVV